MELATLLAGLGLAVLLTSVCLRNDDGTQRLIGMRDTLAGRKGSSGSDNSDLDGTRDSEQHKGFVLIDVRDSDNSDLYGSRDSEQHNGFVLIDVLALRKTLDPNNDKVKGCNLHVLLWVLEIMTDRARSNRWPWCLWNSVCRLTCIVPIAWVLLRTCLFSSSSFSQNGDFDRCFDIFSTVAGYLVFATIFASVFNKCILPLSVTRFSVEDIIRRIKEEREDDKKWDNLYKEVVNLNQEIERLWGFWTEGMAWTILLAILTLFAIASGIMMFLLHDRPAMLRLGLSIFLISTVGTLACLVPLANVTSMCTSGPGGDAMTIRGAASSACHDARDAAGHCRFLSFVSTNTMGIRICGVLITPSLLLSLFLRVVCLVPSLLFLYSKIVHARDHVCHIAGPTNSSGPEDVWRRFTNESLDLIFGSADE